VVIGTATKTAVHQRDMKTSTCVPAMDQRNPPPTKYQEPTKGIQWFGLDGIPEEEPISAMVSETSVYGWKSPVSLVCNNAATNYNSVTHVYGKQAGANTINRSPTTVFNDQLASALFAQQLPPLPKFSGESNDRESSTDIFQEWLEQFEMIAEICNWSSSAKLVNLITRLQDQAYAFFALVLLNSVTVIPSWLLNYKRALHLLGYL